MVRWIGLGAMLGNHIRHFPPPLVHRGRARVGADGNVESPASQNSICDPAPTLTLPRITRGGEKAFSVLMICLVAAIFLPPARADDQTPDKPKVAVFPLGGDSPQALRDRIGFSMRMKLDRDGTYDAIDGPAMSDLATLATVPIDSTTQANVMRDLANGSGADVLIWGDVSPKNGADVIHVRIMDLRPKNPKVWSAQKTVSEATDVRFAVEQILQTLPGVAPFEHPNETSVRHDAESDAAFAKNPNLVPDGDFREAGHWNAIYRLQKYQLPFSDTAPDQNDICIFRMPAEAGAEQQNVAAMNLSNDAASSNGLACLSDAIPIQPGIRYRLQFRYRSDGPQIHVFVKGYASGTDIAGQPADVEVYDRQVPPAGKTDGQWVTVEDDVNPQSVIKPVERLRVDLYAYLKPGVVMFGDVELKAVGKELPQDIAHDDAIKPPATEP